uniref:Secreted protein n=1 Tax=Setaria viridis TaxID=4556 RepID=A0A4U6WGW6_SETVI|nr:hypothetical protein SEVIR_1G306666v2 [Setaria viridis]
MHPIHHLHHLHALLLIMHHCIRVEFMHHCIRVEFETPFIHALLLIMHHCIRVEFMHHCIRVEFETPEQEVGEPEPIAAGVSFEPQGRHLTSLNFILD